jgi:hypothetical protein
MNDATTKADARIKRNSTAADATTKTKADAAGNAIAGATDVQLQKAVQRKLMP